MSIPAEALPKPNPDPHPDLVAELLQHLDEGLIVGDRAGKVIVLPGTGPALLPSKAVVYKLALVIGHNSALDCG